MTKHVGFRIEPGALHYSIISVDNTNSEIHIDTVSKVTLPKSQSEGDNLTYIRGQIESIIKEFGCSSAGIKVAENNARSVSLPRIRMEGVAMEVAHTNNVPACTDTLVTMAPKLGMKSKELKAAIQGATDPMNLGQTWEELNEKQRETVVAAYTSAK